jgi:hypothetical protein
VSGKNTERTEYYDKSGFQIRVSEPKNTTISENGVDYIKIEIINKKEFKIERRDDIFSTNANENKFGNWNNNDIKLTINGQMNENEIWASIRMNSNKHRNLDIVERIKIDRVSGDYEYLREVNSSIGDSKKGEPYILMISTSDNVSKGKCEKFTRKF